MNANRSIPFVDRILNAQKYPVRKNKDGSVSTHLMASASDDQGSFAYPTLRLVNGKWAESKDPRAAVQAGDIIRFKSDQDADYFSRNYKGASTSKIKKAEGGKLPSAYNKYMAQEAEGGTITPMSSDSGKINGPSHEQGGVDLPSYGAEVEGKETMQGDYIFSHRLGFAQQHEPIAKAIGKIEGKAATRERINALRSLRSQEDVLKQKQELLKQILHGN